MSEDSGLQFVSASAWLRATTVGWFVGFLVMLVLTVLGDVVGGSLQSIMGIGIGGGVGYWQSRLLRGVLHEPRRWVLASTAGLSAPLIVWDLSQVVGWDSWFSLAPCVLAGGFAVAVWQWRLLRPHSVRAMWWVLACPLGWSLPALAVATSDGSWLGEPWSFIVGLSGMFFGGAMVGIVTGRPLAWIVEPR